MAYVDTDVIIHTYQSSEDKLIGQHSNYIDKAHPGTNKKISGWKWNERVWATEGELRAQAYAPSIWDPNVSGIDEEDYQSGYGDNNDLLLLDVEEVVVEDQNIWAPSLQHGYFYTRDEEWYLYSDAYLTEHFTVTGVESSQQVLTLTHEYKPTIPIQVRGYKYDRLQGRHNVYRDFRRKVEFSDEPDGPEFIVNTTTNPPKLILDGEYSELVGSEITLSASGTADPAETLGLDFVGLSNGGDDQVFNLEYSPVDPDATVQVWTWVDANFPVAYTIIDPLDDFNPGTKEVKLDRDVGTLTFSEVGSGIVPAAGYHIGAHYTTGLSAMYEPIDTPDDILAYSTNADINPITSATNRGFVQVGTESVDPSYIQLTADLPFYLGSYIISLGNNIGELTALVQGANNDLLEGQEVTFELLEPQVGSFGTTQDAVTAITGSTGQATTLYNSPSTTQGVGKGTVDVVHNGADTVVTVAGIVEPISVEDLFIFRVHATDDVLGIPESGVNTYYNEYLNDQKITEGDTATVEYEQGYRLLHDLDTPVVYEPSDLITGKKTIVLTTRSNTMHPHTGLIDGSVLVPLIPTTIENTGTTTEPILEITYTNVLLEMPNTGETRSYFIVGDSKAQLRAYVTNQRTRARIYSNTINLEVQIPDLVNGTYFCSVLNDIPYGMLTKTKDISTISDAAADSTSGIDDNYTDYEDERIWDGLLSTYETYAEWFKRTKRGDTLGLDEAALAVPDPTLSGLDVVTPVSCPAEIPLGFRLKSTGVTIASVLDQVTYLDPNDHIASGYWD